jgi:hypothetical protein
VRRLVSRLLAASNVNALHDEGISCDTISNGTFAKSAFYNRRFFDIADHGAGATGPISRVVNTRLCQFKPKKYGHG